MSTSDFFDFGNIFNTQDLQSAGLPEDIRAIIGRTFCFQAKQNPESTVYGTVTAVEFNGEGPEIYVSSPQLRGYMLIKIMRDETGWMAKAQTDSPNLNFRNRWTQGSFMLLEPRG